MTDDMKTRILDMVSGISVFSQTRGLAYIITWFHRVTGIILVGYLWLHVYTLSYLAHPVEFKAKIELFRNLGFLYFEWLLAVPVIFHALNGGRLIRYEIYGNRRDDVAIRWVIGLSIIYVVFIILMVFIGNQEVSTIIYWSSIMIAALCVSGAASYRIVSSDAGWAWKLQRISGVFLLVMIPAHMMFMHLNLSAGHDANEIISRMRIIFIKILDMLIMTCALYHGGYGLLSILKDYLSSSAVIRNMTLLVIIISMTFAWLGLKTILFV